jgi:hypothetical protein
MPNDAPAGVVTPVETVAAEPAQMGLTADPAPEPQPEPEKTFSQSELDAILEKRLAKERRKREDLERRAQVAEELALKMRQSEPKAPVSDGEPKREQFESYEAYIEARAEWKAEQKVSERWKAEREREAREKAHTEARTTAESFRKRIQESTKEIPDIVDVIETSQAPITEIMAQAIRLSDVGPKLLYHLAKNPDEAERIAALPLVQQAKEIGRLEATADLTPKKQASRAPQPISPVGGKQVAADKMPDPADNPEGWLKWREAELRKKRA